MKAIPKHVFSFAGGILVCSLLLGGFAFRNASEPKPSAVKEITAPKLPDSISFAGEPVPLDRWDVKERMDRELLFNYYNHANIFYLIKMSQRYFPIISERLKAAGVPDDFKYLCVAESSLQSGVVSRAGATGFWQFMSGTAPGYGLTVNSQQDDRSDIAKSTDAACKYLKQAYAKFGTWTAAAASYNCGMGGYSSNAAYQQSSNYYDLLLPEETNRYIFRILAFKHLMGNSDSLGFVLDEEDMYKEVPYWEVTIESNIPNLAAYAVENGTTYRIIRLMNPALRGKSITASPAKPFVLRLPPLN